MTVDLLRCPECQSRLDVRSDSVACVGCHASFRRLRGIIDFRNHDRDETAAFSPDDDSILAQYIADHFDEFENFNAVFRFYMICWNKVSNGKLMIEEDLIAKCNASSGPMSPGQLAHGPAILEKIRSYAEDANCAMPQAGVALEDGCGMGYFVEGFSKYFDHVIVLDFSLSHLMMVEKIIQERSIEKVTLVCASAERLPIATGSLDFVHSNNVIEHVQDQRSLIAEAHRVLKIGAMLFMISPNRFSIYFEPHFRLPAFGFFPKPIRRWIIWQRQKRSIDDIDLPALSELRSMLTKVFARVYVAFVPSRLSETVTGGRIRGLIVRLLRHRLFGRAANFAINKLLLSIMPYHAAICIRTTAPNSATQV